MRIPSGLAVVKIGGSLFGTPHFIACLEALVAHDGPVALVPGGGPFAGSVRMAQTQAGFGDATAHRMALLAMGQMAEAMADMTPPLCVARSAAQTSDMLANGGKPVWAPHDLLETTEGVTESWDMTSDALAAWLAGKTGAGRVLLVKSAPHDQSSKTAAALAAKGLIDPLFSQHLAASGARGFWIGGGQAGRLERFLAGDGGAAAEITSQ